MRSKKERVLSLEPKWYAFEIIITIVVGLIISLLLVLLSAFIIKQFNIPQAASPIFAVVIKIISIFISCAFCLKRPNGGWLRGGAAGIAYILLSFVVFSFLGEQFSFGLKLLNDAAIGMVVGAISGIVAVNLLRSR